jgi:DNA polymerase-3 subunit gamma/tau
MRDSLSTLDQVLAFCGETVEDSAVVDILGVVDRQLLLAAVRQIIARDTAGLLALVARVDASGCNMRNFCNELIFQIRSLLLLKSAPKSADLLDLSEQELRESSELAQGCDLVTLQRFISILLKTDSDMAHSSFGRLLLEMALIRMATISPVVPVEEILSQLNALAPRGNYGSHAAEPAEVLYRAAPSDMPVRRQSQAPQAVQATAHRETAHHVATQAPPAGDRNWQGFVSYVKTKRPMLGTKLEKASPLQTTDSSLKIGYHSGTLELSMMQEEESRKQLIGLAGDYFGSPVVVTIVALNGSDESVPPSIAEKKSAESARSEKELRTAVENHPTVKATMSIFGGEIVSMNKS